MVKQLLPVVGTAGVVALLRRMIRWRVPPVWYGVALLLPVAVAAGAATLTIAAGGRPPPTDIAPVGDWGALIPLFFVLLLVPGIGGAWEEPGWRGYAQPRLQIGRSALVASLVLGVVWAAGMFR